MKRYIWIKITILKVFFQDVDGFIGSPLQVRLQTVGQLDSRRGFSGNIIAWDSYNKSSVTSTTGLILVEITPIRYELEITNITQENKVKTVKMQNKIMNSQKMSKGLSKINFTTKKTIQWGHIPGVLKGLPVKVGNIHVVWGLKTIKVAHCFRLQKCERLYSRLKRRS